MVEEKLCVARLSITCEIGVEVDGKAPVRGQNAQIIRFHGKRTDNEIALGWRAVLSVSSSSVLLSH